MRISVIVPAKNEAGNLRKVVAEIVSINVVSEILIVVGDSRDSTWQNALQLELDFPGRVFAHKQFGKGKFNAVLHGVSISSGDSIMIWDADGTVPANDNQEIIRIASLQSTCVIGDRLAGIISTGAMPGVNLLGNHLFALLWSPVMSGKKIDLFCGSKIFPRNVFANVPRILKKIDTFGDLSLITTALIMKAEIISLPVRYHARSYGTSNLRKAEVALRFILVSILSFFFFIPKSKKSKKVCNPPSGSE